MARTVAVVHVCVLLALCGTGVPMPTSCPMVTTPGYICTTSSNCTEMVCTITSNTTTLMSASTTIRVQRCDDPPMIDMQAQGMFMNGSSFNFSYQFQESGSVFNGGAFVGTSVQRNWTSLSFSAYIATQPFQYLIPEVTYPINTTQCLCDSMVELADKIRSPLEHDCAPTTDCDGVRCELDIIFTTSYMKVLVLSCAQPPALGVIVEDSNGNPSYSTVVNESSSGVVLIGALAVRLDVLLVHHDYSMDIQANLTYFSNGFEIVPLHTIHLDPNSCSTPPTITPTNPPTPSSPPPDAPDLCITLYNIANSTANPLTCFVVSSCTTLECELVSNNHVYEINMRFLPRENDVKAYMAVIEQRIIWEVRPGNETREYDLEPQGRRLQFSVSATNNSLSLKLILQQDNQQNIIIPESSITLPSAENCLSWVSIISQHPECSYLTDCQGILCFTYYGYIHRATLSVEKCADPVIAQLTLESERGIEFEGNITESTTFGFGWVTMERNDTHLSFSASALYDDIAAWLIPSVSIPLEPRECSCQSLEEWADTEPSPLEHDCATNEDCNGVRCELNVFGTIYHIENILLSCDDPPGIELFVEDENNRPLYATVITHTGQYVVELNSVQIPLYAIVEHHPYSIDVEGNIIIPPFGNITVVPPRKLLLDRTTCPIPPTIFPTTPSPPITFPPTASPTCQSLIDIAKENAEEPFVCGILVDDGGDDCDTLQCHLDILASYSLTIELYPQGAEYVASVSVVVKEGKILADKVNVKEMFDVQLHEGLLTIVFELQGKTLGMLVEVTLESDTTTLINSTVPLKEKEKDEHSSSQKSRLGVQIGIPVVVVCVCVLAVIISIVVVVVWQRKRRAQQFEFKAMSYDLKTKSEQQASASRDATERDSYEPLQSSLQSDV